MPINSDEKLFVYAKAYKSHIQNDQGLLKPILEVTPDGLKPADPNKYINNGCIHVTTGYKFFEDKPDGQFFKIRTNISSSWDEKSYQENISKYVTYDKYAELAQYLSISMIIDADYPIAGRVEGIRCNSKLYPQDGFFIRCNDEYNKKVIIGPFNPMISTIDEQEDGSYSFNYKTHDKPIGGDWSCLNRAPHIAIEIDTELLPEGTTFKDPDNNQEYIVNPSYLPFSTAKLIDLSSDESLLKWLSKLLRATGSELKSKVPELRKLIDNIPEDTDLPLEIFESRVNRLKKHPEKIAELHDLRQIISDYLRTQEGEQLIYGYVEANRDSLLQKHLDDEVEKQKKIAEKRLEQEIFDLLTKRATLHNDVQELEEKWNEIKNSEKGMQLEQLNQRIKVARDEYKIVDDVSKLQTKKIVLAEDIDELSEKRMKAESLLNEIQRNIQKSQETHKSNLLELKMSLDALSGNIRNESGLKIDIIPHEHIKLNNDIDDDVRHEIIETIRNKLESEGRIIDRDNVAVLLTCMMQNLIVTLAGKPGSGKTSSIHSIAEIFGIKSSNKFVHVQVQRGWSSEKELIGFYNKLSIGYEPDAYGLYRLINSLQDVPVDESFSLVLLDEANLSPIEHYWSGFMAACDNADAFTIDNPQSKNALKLPKGTRFVATVNYDRTTEPLSDRFIDRTPVIYLTGLNSEFFNSDYNYNKDDNYISYSYSDLEKIFGRGDAAKLSSDEQRIMLEIKDEHRFININYRKNISITHFTHRLRNILNYDGNDTLKAFDYAVMIFILPLINGQGRDYARALSDFHEFISSQGLIRSSEVTQRIITNSQYDAFSFFS